MLMGWEAWRKRNDDGPEEVEEAGFKACKREDDRAQRSGREVK
jgi:hypothetical protein